mmetsp:Transcript_15915/g.24402  ORF Transcript_15915/g.24402 Transcript_15915/m.24402 type:complete len:270 (+) Transcript_15915:185-994(+)
MKQQEPIISNPMSFSKRKKGNSSAYRRVLLAGIILIAMFMIFAFGLIFDVTTKKDSAIFADEKKSSSFSNETQLARSSDVDKNLLRREADDDLTPEDEDRNGTLVVITKHGFIRIVLQPDLSPESVAYIKEFVAANDCSKCQFYRSEKDLLLQGMMKNPNLPSTEAFGKCPDPNYQPECKDLKCSCHGPIMTRGMVGWAGGRPGGPHWFVDVRKTSVDAWGHQHTVWGELQDEESFLTIQTIQALPVTMAGVSGLYYLDEKIEFTLTLE